MQTVKTIPGKTYAVESAGEVIITNTETGAIAAQGDGSGQVLFTACANSYDVSEDTAKVVALFKLAPRLRLTLLQGVAGGLMPAGFTELEYLESSGTQYINTGLFPDYEWSVEISAANTAQNNANNSFGMFGYSDSAGPDFTLSVYAEISSNNVCWVAFGDVGKMYLSWDVDTSIFHTYYMDNTNLLFDGSPVLAIDAAPFTNTRFSAYLFKYNSTTQNGFVGRVASCILYRSGRKMQELIPALRNADGVAGMWDKVSKQFFVNNGTGSFGYRIKRTGETNAPMSLRDPWRVAPSGVYARLIAENELEVLADTEETTGEGWEWFANTGEAYEHFGITQEELLTE